MISHEPSEGTRTDIVAQNRHLRPSRLVLSCPTAPLDIIVFQLQIWGLMVAKWLPVATEAVCLHFFPFSMIGLIKSHAYPCASNNPQRDTMQTDSDYAVGVR